MNILHRNMPRRDSRGSPATAAAIGLEVKHFNHRNMKI